MGAGALSRYGIRDHWPFALVLAAVIASRLWFALTFPLVQVSDYEAYYNEARGFAGLIPLSVSALNAIGPKLFYAGWFRLFGDSLQGVGVANTLLYSATLCLVYGATLRVFDRSTALLSSAIALCSLSEVYFINLASTEVLGGFFIAAIYFLIAKGSLSWRRALLLGVVGGFAAYNRSNILPIGALVFAHEIFVLRRTRPALLKGITAQLVTLSVTLPLCAFNLSHFGRFTPVIANGSNLWYGNNPNLAGDAHTYAKVPEDFPLGSLERARLRKEFSSFYTSPILDLDFSRMNPYQVDDVRVRYALGWIGGNPGRYIHLIGARFQFLFFRCTYGEAPFRSYDASNPAQPAWTFAHQRLISLARVPVLRLYQFLIAGALLGLIVSLLKQGPSRFLTSPRASPLLIIVFYSLPFLLSLAANRYHIPILSLAWVYLAHGIVLLGREVWAFFRWSRPLNA